MGPALSILKDSITVTSTPDADGCDTVPAGALGLPSPLQTNGVTKTDWAVDNYLAYLQQSAKHAAWTAGLE